MNVVLVNKYTKFFKFSCIEKQDANIIIDEEEYTLHNNLKNLKASYRQHYDALKSIRTEIEYVSHLVDQCRNKLLMEFEAWWDALYVANFKPNNAIFEAGENNQVEDVLDIGEKFDKLQFERMSHEDPDSLPYYNAKKNTERKKIKKTGNAVPQVVGHGGKSLKFKAF